MAVTEENKLVNHEHDRHNDSSRDRLHPIGDRICNNNCLIHEDTTVTEITKKLTLCCGWVD